MTVDIAIVAPAQAPPPFVDAMVASCQAAIGEGRCAAWAPAAAVSWVAVVTWRTDAETVSVVEFHHGGPSTAIEGSRTVAFDAEDPPRLRWASLGLVIAAFAAARPVARQATVAAPIDAPTSFVRNPSEAPAPTNRPDARWGLDGAVRTGLTGLANPVGLGVFLRAWHPLPAWEAWESWARRVSLAASVRYATTAEGAPAAPSAQWWGASMGLGARVGAEAASIFVELQTDALVERVFLLARGPRSVTSSDAEWELGARLGAQAVLRLSSHFSGFVGWELLVVRPRLVVESGGSHLGAEPVVGGAVFLGARFLK